MNHKSALLLALVGALVLLGSFAEAHKKFYTQPQYHEPERCVCDCSQQHRPPPVLPSKPYYGSAGYAQPPPRQGGYGNSGSYAVAGSYGAGGSQVSGGY